MNKNWYTQEEVINLLGVSKTTVYHYAKQGKIKKIPDPYRQYRFVRYEKEEVDRLIQEKNQYPDGIKPSELAEQLGLSVQQVLKHIRSGSIKATKVPYGEERFSYVISHDEVKRIKNNFKGNAHVRIRKIEYYNQKHDIGLFQLFQSADKGLARITKQNDAWGLYILKENRWIPFNEGQAFYYPVYSIHQPSIRAKGNVLIDIPYEEDVLYPFIDYLYKAWGIENFRMREKESSVFFSIKAWQRPFEHEEFNFSDLLSYILKGIIYVSNNLFVCESEYRKTSIELPVKTLEKVKRMAENENITMSEWIENAVEKALVERQQDKYKF